MEKPLTPEEIKYAFMGTNFGDSKPGDVIKWSLLKIASGYSTGGTAKAILQELRLLSFSGNNLTKRGQSCLWDNFKEGYNHE